MKPLEIFRAGRHTASNGTTLDWSAAQLQAVAAAYDPKASEAPIVVGHPTMNAPAYGWVEKLTVDGDKLLAHASQVDPAFAAIVSEGRYKKISASFLPPGHARNPSRASYYLNHVGFLGAHPPAVQGLKAAEFAADAAGILSFADGEVMDYAELERRNAELKARLDAREQGAAAAIIDGLVREGRVTPAERPGVLAFAAALDGEQVLSFSASGGEAMALPMRDFFIGFLRQRAPVVPIAEFAAPRDGVDFGASDDPRAIADEIEAFTKKEAAAGRIINHTAAATHVINRRRQR